MTRPQSATIGDGTGLGKGWEIVGIVHFRVSGKAGHVVAQVDAALPGHLHHSFHTIQRLQQGVLLLVSLGTHVGAQHCVVV